MLEIFARKRKGIARTANDPINVSGFMANQPRNNDPRIDNKKKQLNRPELNLNSELFFFLKKTINRKVIITSKSKKT